jgi:hypothetical protein
MKMYTKPAEGENVSFHYCQCGMPDVNGTCGSNTTVLTDLCVDLEYYDFASSACKVVGVWTLLAAAVVTLLMLASW